MEGAKIGVVVKIIFLFLALEKIHNEIGEGRKQKLDANLENIISHNKAKGNGPGKNTQ